MPYTVLGQVKGEYHQKTLFGKKGPHEEIDKQMRAAAAKLGADAVIQVKYEINSPATRKGFLSWGTAVKFNAPAAQPAAAVVPPPAPVIPPPVVIAAAPPAAVSPVAPPVTLPALPAAAPAAAPAAPAGVIALFETDASGGRAYTVVGAISAAARPTLDKAPKQVLDEDFRAKAAAMGADAVIMIRYDATGASAQGVAVKYK
jgi:uncharacterized protein YbjQ (UPF0145 family)